MKIKQLLAAAALVTVSAGVFADAPVPSDKWPDTASVGKTRAQVRAELVAARKDGTLASDNDEHFPEPKLAKPGKTRQQVREELIASERSGEYDRLMQEYN